MKSAPSLTRQLVWRLSVLQVLIVTLTFLAAGILATPPSDRAYLGALYAARTLGDEVRRTEDGRLELQDSPAVQEMRRHLDRGFWFHITDGTQTIAEGHGPERILSPSEALQGDIESAELAAPDGSFLGAVQATSTPQGRLMVTAGPIDRGIWATIPDMAENIDVDFLLFALPLVACTMIAVPLIIRSALRALGRVAGAAAQIDPDRRGDRLPAEDVPREIVPLVTAVNDALSRLDQGYDRQRRFLTDAAHELRTPIAILKTRLEAFGDTAIKTHLGRDLGRLELLADQLLDLERLRSRFNSFVPVDLVALARNFVGDLAPLALAAGYDLAVEAKADRVEIDGDRLALERALANLIHNAIQHGGRTGAIVVWIDGDGGITVRDEGPGIPDEMRDRIFEPFFRAGGGAGAGLGLNLVREIAHAHGGHVAVGEGPGAVFHLDLPCRRPSGMA